MLNGFANLPLPVEPRLIVLHKHSSFIAFLHSFSKFLFWEKIEFLATAKISYQHSAASRIKLHENPQFF